MIWFVLITALIAACGQPQSAATDATPVTEATSVPATPSPDSGKILLRVGTGDSGDGLQPHNEIIARFEAENPDIQVQLEPVGSGDYYQIIRDQIASGNPSDLLQIGDDAVPSFVESGAFLPLDGLIAGAEFPLDTSIYLPGVLDPGKWAGKQYLLPKDYTPLAVYYNKKIFDRFGVAYPQDGWTWEEFLATAQALTKDTNGDGQTDIWGAQLPGSWAPNFEYWSASAGGQLVSADGLGFIGYMDSPQNTEALQFYSDLYHMYHIAPITESLNPFDPNNNQFASGAAAMLLFGRWPLAKLRTNPDIELGVVGLPTDRRRANILLWGGFGISALSQHQDAAWRFLRFYAGEPGAQVWKDWALPTVRSVAEAAGMTADPIDGVWLNELNYLAPRAYISMPIWPTAGEPAVSKLLDRVIRDPNLDISLALYDAAQDAQGAMIIQK
ncbi:sugar ABC transporter substrate-binding protein [Chloroflexales bacterium ZM16-3]|nr:sugar ABC transporter substrate-binding protein [Chloroflexales bacterium ZM16-3]